MNLPPPVQEILEDVTSIFDEFQQTAGEVLAREDGGEIDDETSDDILAEAIEEMASSLYKILEVDVEEEVVTDSDMMEASHPMNQVASFSLGFGQILASLITETFNDPKDGIAFVSEITDLDPDEIAGVLAGDLAVHPDAAADLAEAFQLGGDDFHEFVNLAAAAYEELGGGEDEEDSAEYSAPDVQLRAEFEAMKEREAVSETLRAIERQCDQLVANGSLTTHERRLLIGEFETNQDRVAQFSAACSQLQVPPGQQLDRIQYYLYIAQSRPPLAMFGQYVEEPLETTPYSQDDLNMINDFRSRHGFK